MFPYAAYLRVYEPVTAFPEPARTLWTAYADSRRRPRRAHALGAEHAEAARRLVAAPPEVAPDRESRHAYVRRDGDMIYISPWQTRLRCWLAFERFRAEQSRAMAAAFVPPVAAEAAAAEFERWKRSGRSLRPFIASSNWHVPLAWFVPFTAGERCLVLGGAAAPGAPGPAAAPQVPEAAADLARRGPATTAPARTLVYVTAMSEARRRLSAALPVVRANVGEGDAGLGGSPPLAAGRLEELGRWLAEFHPGGLVELDYGGLVHLMDDRALRSDESVAETAVALAAMARGEVELAVAMYKRLLARWRPVRALESAN
ncbi:hypothetical protein [Actinomadura parmotrematis]|uniref:DUF8083 domain-containing protein n=1 Tax=Actinomadura parmotrematis TaxID=2864039 RepID=A0ABS7FNW5_9ACTN|nr:hypothetical protein [Actinomadura parmotrematis]MBW8482084.1 hypothetical protein [Actinomadura parmotrematis]